MSSDIFTEKFGKIAIKNKMIDMEKWGEALALKEQNPNVGVDVILQKKGYMKPNQALAIIAALKKQGISKDGAAPPAAAAPAPKPAPKPAPAMQEEVIFQTPQKSASSSSLNKTAATPRSKGKTPEIERILRMAKEAEASDLHIKVGSPPLIRQHGVLRAMELPENKAADNEKSLFSLLSEVQQKKLRENHQLDFCYDIPGIARYRSNIYKHQKGYDASFRIIPAKLRTISELGLPEIVLKLSHYNQGLALFTGPSGCGKSCTMAAIVDEVNRSRKDNIITMEDPIEMVFESKGCNVMQREVHTHTKSFANALRASLREDPDVIMIGELRDLETVSLSITASETGHLVLGTLHTTNAYRTIDRLLDVFPPKEQAQVRSMLSEALRGVVSQQLVPRKDKRGRVMAYEILFVTPAVGNLIREQKTFQIPSVMQTGKKFGMKLMDDVLVDLLKKGLITKEEAIFRAEKPSKFATV